MGAPIVIGAVASPAAGAPVPLYPDLETLPPRELRFDRADITPELSGVFHNVLRFSNTTYNVGEGPLNTSRPEAPTRRRSRSTRCGTAST